MSIVDFQHVKLGRGDAFLRAKFKNFITGKVVDETFRTQEKISQVIIKERRVTYLYTASNIFYFLDTETGEEITLPLEKVTEQKPFIKEGDTVSVFESGEEVIALQLPPFVELKVIKTSPGVKGDTVSGGSKPAQLETGLRINVPIFIKEGDMVKVDTERNEYVERVE